MSKVARELQEAVFERLSGDAAVTAALGSGDRIHDRVPERRDFPFLTFGRTAVYDWSTDTERGDEHLFTIQVRTRDNGRGQTLEIMEAVRAALQGSALAMDSHRLVNLTLEYTEVQTDPENRGDRGLLRYRAVTEPI